MYQVRHGHETKRKLIRKKCDEKNRLKAQNDENSQLSMRPFIRMSPRCIERPQYSDSVRRRDRRENNISTLVKACSMTQAVLKESSFINL